MKTFDEYSKIARQSDFYPKVDRENPVYPGRIPPDRLPVYPALAMAGECGEFSEKVKKAWRDGSDLDRDACLKELGDVLWYIDAAAKDMGYTLEQVAQANLDKITSRRQRGVMTGSGDDR